MKKFLSILCLLLVSSSFTYSQEKKVNVDGVEYIIDISTGTASVGYNYTKSEIGTAEGDIVLASSISYKKKKYPVTSIRNDAFACCFKLNSMTISSTISQIGELNIPSKNFKYFFVVSDNPYFQSKDGVIFSKDMTEIVRYPKGRDETSYSIPPTVVSIGKIAFVSCRNLINIELPPSISIIGVRAFSNCSNLTSVCYQNKHLVFPTNAFEYCSSLPTSNIIYKAPTALFLELAKKGNPEDQYKLAMCYLTEDDFPKDIIAAKEWFMKASENGHVPSQKALGDIYFSGIGVEKNFVEAIKWYSLAANAGNASAQCALGDCYFHGVGVKQDFSTAINYYKSAASQGENKAEEILGHCYYSGDGGIDIDYKEAVLWYTLAANNGNTEAAYYLAICYSEGQGIDKNDSEALKWVEKAVDGGIEKGQGLYCVLAYNDAVASMNSKYYSSAISRFTSLLKFEKDNIDAYINRGYCYLNQQVKDYTSAEKDFEKALELDGTNEAAKTNLQFVKDYYQRIIDAKDLCAEGDKYYNQKDYTNAVASYAKSISLDNTKPYPYYLIGYCYYACDLYADAINYFDQALSVDPNYTNATKARKSARTILVLNAVSGALTTVSNTLNNAYSSSVNYGSSSSYSSSSNTSSSVKSSQQNANGTGKQATTNNNDYYNQYYTKESQKSKDQADYYYNEAQKYLKNVEYYVKENNTDKASLNRKWYEEAMDKYKQYSGYANDEQRKAQNYK